MTTCKVCGKTASIHSNFLLTEEGIFCNNRCYQFFLENQKRKESEFFDKLIKNYDIMIKIEKEIEKEKEKGGRK